MPEDPSQIKILAHAIYEIRLLLSAYLGSQNTGDINVRQAAHISYALHNAALSIIEGGTFDSGQAAKRLDAVDRIFGTSFSPRFLAQT